MPRCRDAFGEIVTSCWSSVVALSTTSGDWLVAVALPAFVYVETGSGRATATIVVTELVIGIVFGPYGGSLADRWDLRRTIIATNIAQAVAMLPLLAVTRDSIWPAFVVAAIQGLLVQINNPASFAIVPRIVPADQLVTANSANNAAGSIARLIGSPLGGIAVALGGLGTVVAIDAITFLAVAGAIDSCAEHQPPASLLATARPTAEERVCEQVSGWFVATQGSPGISAQNPWLL